MTSNNVDRNGIPRRGFIKADKMRARREREQQITDILLHSDEPAQNVSLFNPLNFSRALIIACLVLLMLTVYLLGEKRGFLSASDTTEQRTEKRAVNAAGAGIEVEEIGALWRQLEAEKDSYYRSQNALGQQNQQLEVTQQQVTQTSKAAFATEKQTLNSNDGESYPITIQLVELDRQSSSLGDPFSGRGSGGVDPEIEKMRRRAINMINAQPKAGFENRQDRVNLQ